MRIQKSIKTETLTQLQVTEILIGEVPKTMLQISVESNILRANICRYISRLRKENRVILVNTGICPISKYRAGFFSSEPFYLESNV